MNTQVLVFIITQDVQNYEVMAVCVGFLPRKLPEGFRIVDDFFPPLVLEYDAETKDRETIVWIDDRDERIIIDNSIEDDDGTHPTRKDSEWTVYTNGNHSAILRDEEAFDLWKEELEL